ncbi:cytochrome P450 [Actinomadura macrotermitis]|uniref:Putative cytochrome P450 135B1 n=1 Tax=Actinomadura macrotermitis TaxID=2585200 RepID=A0A7K0C7E1_9ACTN|nr:cytochrome P450 [Actinomadura macrotermitis]MQY09377.1 putative cytochrome P450 135B1 [Actinomadura macrotermitis]
MPAPPAVRLPPPLQVAWLVKDPVGFYEAGRRRHGPVFQVRYPGLPPEVVVATAGLAEQVFATDAGASRAGEIRRAFVGPLVGERSLLCLDREPWWRHRRLINPALHGRAVAGWRDRIAAIAAAEIAGWPLGAPFALRDRMERITLEVIMRMVFGVRDAGRLRALRALLPRLVALGGSAALLRLPPRLRDRALTSPALLRAGALPTTRYVRVRDEVDAILYDEIARRRGAPDPDAADVLSHLVAARDEDGAPLTDQELRDELMTLLQAGHETTATALAWTFERLLRNPDALRRLRTELAAGEGGEYLQAVVKEALRARPVVLGAPRLLDEPVRIGGYDVPAGHYLSASIPLVLSDPAAYPEPWEFRPERFLGPGADLANRSWIPFGGGHRYCAGAQLAQLELRVVITEVLRAVDLAPARPAPERPRLKNVTLAPSASTQVVAYARTSGDHVIATGR